MRSRTSLIALLGLSVATIAACSPTGPPAQANYAGYQGPQPGDTSMLGQDGLTFGTAKTPKKDDAGSGSGGAGTGVAVNAYLWRGALDTLSFMPLASADPFGGVIITDWYTPPGSGGERFKATAYILGRQLRSDGIRVVIYRQVLQDGQWVDAPVSPVTTGEIEDKVLVRARQLREQSAGA
jgi:Domain of unknown function (DUF3576)